MEEKYYVVEVTIGSTGTETRNFTPYTNKETALRKFYAPLGSIGAGPSRISVLLLNAYLDVVKKETWEQEVSDTIVMPIQDPNFIPVTD